MTFSLNNRLALEQYVKNGLRSEVKNGIATPGQRDGLKGLRVLVSTTVNDGSKYGRYVPVGSIAYIREESLYNQPWATKLMSCDFLNEKFMVVELHHIEFINTPDEAA